LIVLIPKLQRRPSPFGYTFGRRLGGDVHRLLFDLLHGIEGDRLALDSDGPSFFIVNDAWPQVITTSSPTSTFSVFPTCRFSSSTILVVRFFPIFTSRLSPTGHLLILADIRGAVAADLRGAIRTHGARQILPEAFV